MPDTPKYTDEYIERSLSGIASLVSLESQYPRWFSYAVILADIEDGSAQAMDLEFKAAGKAAYKDLHSVLDNVRAALDEGAGPAAERCLRDLVTKCLEKIDTNTEKQKSLVRHWKGARAKGKRRGYHHKFAAELDKHPEWLERLTRGKGEGWQYSFKEIEKSLPSNFPMPSRATVDRIRFDKIARNTMNINEPQQGKK